MLYKIRENTKASRLKIYPGYAPLFGPGRRCDNCAGRPYCNVFVSSVGWVLCEAPDQKQKESMERQGIDLLQITTELWDKHPEIWEES